MLNIKSAFYSVIHNQEILKLAEADQKVIQDIRDRVELRVNVGESPRYELIKLIQNCWRQDEMLKLQN